jgi:porin
MKINVRLFCVGALASCATAWGGAPQPFSDDLTLDWDGFRNALHEEGIDFHIGYVSETATNVKGGPEEDWSYTDQWTFLTTLDLQTLLDLNEAKLRLAITDRNGHDLSDPQHLNDLQLVQEVYGRGQTWRLTQFWYDQAYFNDHLDWKIGRITDGEDFAAFNCQFQNLTFCGAPVGNIVGSYWYNWPVSQWATRLKVSFTGFGYVELGAFEVNPNYLLTGHGLSFGDPGGATGVLVPFEIGWLPTFGPGYDGSYKFGGWYNSNRAPDVVNNTQGLPLAIDGGTPEMHNGQYGVYVNFLQRVMAPAGADSPRGLRVFFNATFADRSTSTLDNQVALGLFYTGPFASRPADELGFGIGRTHVNNRIGDAERLQNALGVGAGPVAVQSSEYEAEIYYNFGANRWLNLRPNVQYINQPGGIARASAQVVLGLKLAANL